MARKTKDLIQIIRDNPGCVAVVDNDCWYLYRVHPENNPFHDEETDGLTQAQRWKMQDKWDAENTIASSDDTFNPRLGDGGYGSGNCYGGDLLQALAVIVGVKIESV